MELNFFKIIKMSGGFHFKLFLSCKDGSRYDYQIAQTLNISYGNYLDLIEIYGAYDTEGEIIFLNEDSAKEAIKKLEPYFIMANLTE